MIKETSFPVFASGQVLTSGHLNDLAEYLEQQDRLTRSKTLGIGILCGFELDLRPQQGRLRISGGAAITSDGHVIVEDASDLTHFRPYRLPVTDMDDRCAAFGEEEPYRFFMEGTDHSIEATAHREMWELLPDDYAGETDVQPLTATSLAGKVVLFFLESVVRSRRSCNVNDCSDRGCQQTFTLRKLVVSAEDAREMRTMEQGIAGRPVDRGQHPGYDLDEWAIEKINPAAHRIETFEDLSQRIQTIWGGISRDLSARFTAAYEAYRYLLEDLYPRDSFPSGPFGDENYLLKVETDYQDNVLLVQYLYDYARDVVHSHNEFVRTACRLEMECCPDERRFPRHVLLGVPNHRPTAFRHTFADEIRARDFDPLSAKSGRKPPLKPKRLRHHFIPSQLFGEGRELLERARSLHYRTYLLAYRYDTGGLMNAPIRITPSKNGGHDLSEKALPFYYRFEPDDDLHRNWSYDKTTKNRLADVQSHRFSSGPSHPLKSRLDEHDFYQIEGIVGKPLGFAMRELARQRTDLGLSFGVEPVFLGLRMREDGNSKVFEEAAFDLVRPHLQRMMLCRMRDLDVIFLVLMAMLFYFLFIVIALLSRIPTHKVVRPVFQPVSPPPPPPPPPTGGVGSIAFEHLPSNEMLNRVLLTHSEMFRMVSINTVLTEIEVDRTETEALLQEFRPTGYQIGAVTQRVTIADDPKDSLGAVYRIVKDRAGADNLFDKLRLTAGAIDATLARDDLAHRIYPTVSLLDKAEALVEVVSAPSIAEFDFQEFETRYDSFVKAFDAFLDRTADVQDAEFRKTRESLRASHSAMAAAGPQSIFRNLGSELSERMRSVLEELVLTGYRKRHPGLQHAAGVPVGGTLVLLYTHKSFVGQVLEENKDRIETDIRRLRALRSGPVRAVEIRNPRHILNSVVSTGEPLDDYVVLADFCLPYLCCETDCIDTSLPTRPGPAVRPGVRPGVTIPPGALPGLQPFPGRPPVVGVPPSITRPPVSDIPPGLRPGTPGDLGLSRLPTNVPGTVRGTVFGRGRTGAGALRPPGLVENLDVVVTDLDTNRTIDVNLREGDFDFVTLPGTFRIDVSGRGLEPMSRFITVGPGSDIIEDIILNAPDPTENQPGTVGGTVFGRGRRTDGALRDPEVVANPAIVVTDLGTGERVEGVRVANGRFEFTGPPGDFRIDVGGGVDLGGATRTVTLRSGGTIEEDVVLVAPAPPPADATPLAPTPADAPTEPTSTRPRPSTPVNVTGTVFGRRRRAGELTQPNVADDATVTVTNVDTGSAVDVEVRDGRFEFSGPPGRFRIDASGGSAGLDATSRVIEVRAGESVVEDIVIMPPGMSDLPTAPVVEPAEPGEVSGTVFGRRERSGELTQPNPVTNAEVTVTEAETGTPVPVDVSGGNFSFRGRPGNFRITTRDRGGLGSTSRLVTVPPGGRTRADIVIRPPGR